MSDSWIEMNWWLGAFQVPVYLITSYLERCFKILCVLHFILVFQNNSILGDYSLVLFASSEGQALNWTAVWQWEMRGA